MGTNTQILSLDHHYLYPSRSFDGSRFGEWTISSKKLAFNDGSLFKPPSYSTTPRSGGEVRYLSVFLIVRV
ncbi:hypothetical protein BVRB_6g137700 [Beta vulgaris subsp. vulgaris]|nr:hypothetical protein BVRB_6g137700 [Beta vulgaris subsp. vulgaris]